ncbi:MAG: CRTAC1 family protein [Planctomycetes bacterium]|nr:CRTAC1 family protein [Planctomycetota bacterium]
MTHSICLLFLTGLAVLAQDPGPPLGDGPDSAAAGHRRMLETLARYEAVARRTNLYLGEKVVEDLARDLDAIPGGERESERFRLALALGLELLRLGRVDEAIARYDLALAVLGRVGAGVPSETVAEAHFRRGVAHLRRGEDRNCCARRTKGSCILPIQESGRHSERAGSEAAIRDFTRVLELSPPSSMQALQARWTLNLAHMTLGSWPVGVPERWRVPPSAFASEAEFPHFEEVATDLGLDDEMLAGGAAAEDFDGDLLTDLLVTNSDTAGAPRLYLRTSEGAWVDRSAEANLTGLFGGLNVATADYDGDGDVDVYVMRGAWWRDGGEHVNSLLQNDGRGRFVDVTYAAGLGVLAAPGQTACWADYDRDGDLDLFVGHESEGGKYPSQLFQNQGDGRFVDRAREAGVTNDRYAKGAVWADFDEDGFPDLYVSNMAAPNRLYRNRGDGTFEDVARAAGVGLPFSGFGCIAFDQDQDGHLDLWVAGFGGPNSPPSVADVAAGYLGLPQRGERMRLYRGDGRGGFTEVGESAGLARAPLPMGINCGDVDGDGYEDLYLGTGYPFYEGLVPNLLLKNVAGRRFADVTTASGTGHLQKGHGVVIADLDGDGDLDLFERVGGAYPGDAYGNVLFRNPGFGNRWIKVRLVGADANRFGVGARIEVEVEAAGARRTIHRTVGTGGSFGCNPLRQEIGLGRAERVTALRVRWPRSGSVETFTDVPLDAALSITEGSGRVERQPR